MDWARQHECAGMQFNAVAESNRSAVELYKRLGFDVIGTVPGASRIRLWVGWTCTSCTAPGYRTGGARSRPAGELGRLAG